MSLYRHKVTGEVKDLDPAQIQAWIDAGNPKGAHYSTQWEPYAPPAPEQPTRYRVSKDTLMSRVAAAGDQYVLALDDVLQAQPRARQILWRDFAWFHSDNQSVRGLIAHIGLDPEVILAPEDSA